MCFCIYRSVPFLTDTMTKQKDPSLWTVTAATKTNNCNVCHHLEQYKVTAGLDCSLLTMSKIRQAISQFREMAAVWGLMQTWHT